MAGPGEIEGLPPGVLDGLGGLDLTPDLGSLSYPWDAPPAAVSPDAAAAQLEQVQPGLGIPTSTLDPLVAGMGAPPAPAGEPPPNPPPFDAGAAPVDLTPPPPSAAPQLTPDALTGAGGMPPTGELGGQPYAAQLTPEQRYAQVAGNYAANPGQLLDRLTNGPIDADTQRYLNEFAARDQPGFAELMTRMGDAKLKREGAERARIQSENHDREMANLAMRQKGMADAQKQSAAIDAEATAIANTKIGYHPTTFQRIAGVIAAVIGGLYQGKTGSARNPGLDALNDTINRDLEEQRTNLVNRRDVVGMRRSALAETYARTGDMFQANEVARLAALKHADELLATQQQNFAPDGMRGLQIAQLRTGINSQIATNRAAVQQKSFDNSIKLQGASREQQIADETLRHNRASEGVEYARLDIERGKERDKGGPVFSPEQWAQIHPDNPVPPVAYNEKDYQAFLTARKTGNEIANQTPETVRGVPGVYVPDLKTGADKTFVATGEPSEVAKLRSKVAASRTIVHLLDTAARIRDGYSNNNVADRKQWQELKQIWSAASAKGKDSLGLGALSADDYKLLNGYLGTDDPTSFRDPSAGIQQARRTVLLDLNDSLHSAGYPEGHTFGMADTSKPARPKETVDDKALKLVLDDPEKAARANFDPAGAPTPARGEWDPFPEQQRVYRGETLHPDYRGHGILLQKQQLDEWAKRARDLGSTGHDDAWTMLADAAGRAGGAKGAATAEVRDYARALLNTLMAGEIDRIPAGVAPAAAAPEAR